MYSTAFMDWTWESAGATEAEVKASVNELMMAARTPDVKFEVVMPATADMVPSVKFRAWTRSSLVAVLQAEERRWGNTLSRESALEQIVEVKTGA